MDFTNDTDDVETPAGHEIPKSIVEISLCLNTASGHSVGVRRRGQVNGEFDSDARIHINGGPGVALTEDECKAIASYLHENF